MLHALEKLCPAALHSSCTDLHPLNAHPRLALQLLEGRAHFSCCEITYSTSLKLKDYGNSIQDPKANASIHYTQACLQPAQVAHYVRPLESDSAPAPKEKKNFFSLVLACCRAAPESQSSDGCNSCHLPAQIQPGPVHSAFALLPTLSFSLNPFYFFPFPFWWGNLM